MSNAMRRNVVAMMVIAGGLAAAMPAAAVAAPAKCGPAAMKCGAKSMHHKAVRHHRKRMTHKKAAGAKCGAKCAPMSGGKGGM
jgi:hypothetical protein